MRVTVDQARCIGSGQCVVAEPSVFDQDDQECHVVLLEPRPAPARLDGVRRAADDCPMRAITIHLD